MLDVDFLRARMKRRVLLPVMMLAMVLLLVNSIAAFTSGHEYAAVGCCLAVLTLATIATVIDNSLMVAGLALLVMLSASSADACNHCGYSACGGCYKAAVASPAYGYDIVYKPDGTYWRNGVEVERLQVFRYGKWGWGWFPKGTTVQSLGIPLSANAQGSTVYGYANRVETYGQPIGLSAFVAQADPNLALNQGARLTESAISLAKQGFEGNRALGAQVLETERIQAASAATVATIQAASTKGPEKVETHVTIQGTIGSDGKFTAVEQEPGRVQAFGQPAPSLSVLDVIDRRCVACHSGAKPGGGLDLTGNIDGEAFDAAWARVTTGDPAKRMPPMKDKSGNPLAPLTPEEIGAFVRERFAK